MNKVKVKGDLKITKKLKTMKRECGLLKKNQFNTIYLNEIGCDIYLFRLWQTTKRTSYT